MGETARGLKSSTVTDKHKLLGASPMNLGSLSQGIKSARKKGSIIISFLWVTNAVRAGVWNRVEYG